MTRLLWLLLLVVSLAACTTSEQYRRPDGGHNYVIACGAALGWNICLSRAKEECPIGFDVLSQVNDGNRKEMTIACADRPPQAVSDSARAAANCRLRLAETGGANTDAERVSRVKDCILAAGYVPE